MNEDTKESIAGESSFRRDADVDGQMRSSAGVLELTAVLGKALALRWCRAGESPDCDVPELQ